MTQVFWKTERLLIVTTKEDEIVLHFEPRLGNRDSYLLGFVIICDFSEDTEHMFLVRPLMHMLHYQKL